MPDPTPPPVTPTQTSIVTGTIAGTDIPPDQQPISKWDWYKLSRTWIFGYEERLKSQVESIQSAIKWFFTLGSTATILGVIFKDPKLGKLSMLLFGIALALLLISYALATLSITLTSRSMKNPDSFNDIRKAFNTANIVSKILILISSLALVAGMALFPLAIVTSFQRTPSANPSTPSFVAACQTTIQTETKTLTGIDVSGFTPDSTKLNLRLSSGTNFFTATVIESFQHVLQHGKFDMFLPLAKPIKLTKSSLYLTLVYKKAADTLASQTIKLTP